VVRRIVLDSSAIDPEFKAHAARGTGRYVSELVQAFKACGVSDRDHDQDIAIESRSLNAEVRSHCLYGFTQWAPFGRTTIATQLLAPSSLRRLHADYVHFPAHIDAPSWSPVPTIVTVLDLIPLLFPDHYRPKNMSWRFRLARFLELRAIRAATGILAISECTKRDLIRLLDIPSERITVTPLGVDRKFFEPIDRKSAATRLRAKHSLPADAVVVLYVGGIDWRKNMRGLCALTAEIHAAQKRPVFLLMVGSIRNDDRYPELLATIRSFKLETQIIEAGFVPDEELLYCYAGADIFLFPSLYEGFGLPVLEAMAAGVPVLVSNRASLPEIVDRAELLFNPDQATEIVPTALRLLSDTNFSEQVREWGRRRAEEFRWDETARLTLEFYRHCCDTARDRSVQLRQGASHET
jgi:glycosyltransferase involved in cell wall biosynthesis